MKLLIMMLFSISALADRYVVYDYPVSVESVRVMRKAGFKEMKHFSAYTVNVTKDQADELLKRGFKLEADVKVKALGVRVKRVSASSQQNETWGYTEIGAGLINKKPNGSGEGIVVCVVDTGVDYEHPELDGQIVGGYAIVKTSTSGKLEYYDDMGHGTHVSGTIAGLGKQVLGVASKSKIYAVKVLDQNGEGYFSDVADGLLSCIGKAKVVNMSLGGSAPSKLMEEAVKKVKAAGMFISCAAGNEYGPVGYPAVYPECYAVSAVNKDMRLADFSNRGKEIDFAAPGVGIKSSVPSGGYEEWDGTSMAAPHVSGTIAIMLSRNKRKLKAKNIGLHQEEQGFGLIDAYKTGKNFFPWQN